MTVVKLYVFSKCSLFNSFVLSEMEVQHHPHITAATQPQNKTVEPKAPREACNNIKKKNHTARTCTGSSRRPCSNPAPALSPPLDKNNTGGFSSPSARSAPTSHTTMPSKVRTAMRAESGLTASARTSDPSWRLFFGVNVLASHSVR